MNKEQQIKKLAEEIYRAGVALDGSDFAHKSDHFERLAEVLHKAGYRKQSETVKEFAEKLTKRLTKEVKDNPEAAASQYKAGLYFAMDLAEQYGKEKKE